MPKYRANITFDLQTSVEPDGHLDFDPDGIEDLSDDSYVSSEEVEVSGGEVSFDIEADDDSDASEKALDLFQTYASWDDNELDWEIANATVYSIDLISEPMTLQRAGTIAVDYLTKLYHLETEIQNCTAVTCEVVSGYVPTAEEREALDYLVANACGEKVSIPG